MCDDCQERKRESVTFPVISFEGISWTKISVFFHPPKFPIPILNSLFFHTRTERRWYPRLRSCQNNRLKSQIVRQQGLTGSFLALNFIRRWFPSRLTSFIIYTSLAPLIWIRVPNHAGKWYEFLNIEPRTEISEGFWGLGRRNLRLRRERWFIDFMNIGLHESLNEDSLYYYLRAEEKRRGRRELRTIMNLLGVGDNVGSKNSKFWEWDMKDVASKSESTFGAFSFLSLIKWSPSIEDLEKRQMLLDFLIKW